MATVLKVQESVDRAIIPGMMNSRYAPLPDDIPPPIPYPNARR